MTQTDTKHKEALERYHQRYTNQLYQQIATVIADNLAANRESKLVVDAMNLITDTAIEATGSPAYVGAHHKLAIFAARNELKTETIDQITAYLRVYATSDDICADDFHAITNGLLKAYAAKDAIYPAASHANGIHSWKGRMAYELLVASQLFVEAAINLMLDESENYISEKLRNAFHRTTGALYEAIRGSATPRLFNFKGIYFPDEKDRR